MLKINNIYQGDCIDFFQKIDSNTIDLIIADPPYNLGKDFGNGIIWNDVEKWLEWSKEWIKESKRVLKDTGSIFIYGIHKYICFIQCYLYEIDMKYGRQFIWHYENGWSGYKRFPSATYEPILWFKKTENHTYHTIREPYKSKERLKHKIIKNGKIWTPNPKGKHGGDIWNIPTLAGRRFRDEKVDHPTQKPLALCDKIINHFSNPKDLILIPFSGSGSECVSAIQNDRKYIGFEINKSYIDMTFQRFKSLNLKT